MSPLSSPPFGAFQNGNRIFSNDHKLPAFGAQRPITFCPFPSPPPEANQVQQFTVKALVERVAVVGKWLFEQVRREKILKSGMSFRSSVGSLLRSGFSNFRRSK
ncbi:MAG: hypothetical protein R2825_15055 [Saprospiraceae bacterium]